ncbi:MAG: hypothetical protein UV64_C0010G0013 [Parcubacteria group bacterium GW2011_GWC1_43_11b]|uniref:Uncharacterized protein n=1 Tax=Candidatus Vogelbacteria bacterium RIFOXYB1_FULL_42_16 TaxID=1802436 RepID=A0A1G2QBG6_9BACT|nr:MAG: hypothetical protein UV50_C0007G0015 [Parcubacteria group bacterium GW2011_GWB1_42_9]KKS89172.1 MAG: hypothetical protein UV64_C0010G0013 [Parcubacteria group bacterium GW2011_GWC1_43_11b]KKT09574.1 MAG: hypothetical protein UV88_C0007G0009 [Parcubacteria group bacterium GW2011_GWA1_43_21]OHA57900.1 MAG: hypothetical protein A2370_02725 [Candidatus Vogelbacteria bacterium RIFOXYB1_FULL_42_16]
MNLSIAEFRKNTGITDERILPVEGQIVPLRLLSGMDVKIVSVSMMPEEYLKKMLAGVTLVDSPNIHPYANAAVVIDRVAPFSLRVIQTFVLRRKLVEFLERFDNVFQGFHVSHGIAKKMPMIVVGEGPDQQFYVSHYLPPIVEKGPQGTYLLDGQHRCFMCGRVGTTIEAVKIIGVSMPPRAELLSWDQTDLVDEKPELRVIGGDPYLFRDLDRVGVDG